MQNIQIFNFEENEVRSIDIDGTYWWVLKDVCDVLEIINTSQLVQRLDEDERSMFNIGRQGEVNIINESGLYNVILRSDKPKAKPFKKWITNEVLPSIRRTGSYSLTNNNNQIILIEQRITDLENKMIDYKVQRLEEEYYKLNPKAINLPSYLKDRIHDVILEDCMP